jgi:DNA polymerase III subunit delta'
MRLADIAGQERAVTTLLHAVTSGRVAHACLFDGPESVGKRSAALGLALALACSERPGQGCGACDTCRRILAGNHPDVLTFAPETNQYKVEQAREIVALAATRPHEAPARVLILDGADALNPSSANCLLKTLEEPCPGNHLVLVTSAPDRLLPTLRSRTQRVRFLALSAGALIQIAMGRGASRAQAETAAALAGGQAGRLLEALAAEAESSLWGIVGNLRKAAAASGVGPIMDAAAEFSDKESREDLPEALGLLARLYRDALMRAAGASDLVLLRDRAGDIEALANRAQRDYDLRALRTAVREVVQASNALLANMNPVTALEKMLMDLRNLEAGLA